MFEMVEDMPRTALSLRQPWAHAVIHLGRGLENRTWWSAIRGPIWIAASAQVTWKYYHEAAALIEKVSGVKVPPLDDLPLGAVVGRATIVDCILPGGHSVVNRRQASVARQLYQSYGTELTRADPDLPHPGPRHPLHPHPWHFIDQYGYVLEDVRKLEQPVPVRGHQRWFKLPKDVLDQLRRQS